MSIVRNHTKASVAFAMVLGLMVASAAPASATDNYAGGAGNQTQVLTGGTGSGCVQYKDLDAVIEFAEGSEDTTDGPTTAHVESQNGVTWYGGPAGTYDSAACATDPVDPGPDEISGFDVTVTSADAVAGTRTTCTATDGTFIRDGVETFAFTNATCHVVVVATGATTTTSGHTVTITATIVACNSPIAPIDCVITATMTINPGP